MKQLKGFSLMEVLIALMLMTTTVLILLEQQWKTHLIIKQWILRAEASHFLDNLNEALYDNATKPSTPAPFHLTLQQDKQSLILNLQWQPSDSICRKFIKGIN